jgi:GT2 family glycosyltransferase
MNEKVAVFIVNYNMPERTDKLFERLSDDDQNRCVYVIDNGSDLLPISPYTSIVIPMNLQTTGGWMYAYEKIKRGKQKFFAYMFMITSAEIPKQEHFLKPLVDILLKDKDAVIVHPALTKDSTTYWQHMKTDGSGKDRRTWMADNIACLYRADWFDENSFDKELLYGWGIDLEASWKARSQGKHIWICENSFVKKETDIGYTMDRMNMSANDRRIYATANADEILNKKYGRNWRDKLVGEYRDGLG